MTAFRIEIPERNWACIEESQAKIAGALMLYFQKKHNWKVNTSGYLYDRDARVYAATRANNEAVVILATIAMGLDLDFVLTHIFEEMVDTTFNRK